MLCHAAPSALTAMPPFDIASGVGLMKDDSAQMREKLKNEFLMLQEEQQWITGLDDSVQVLSHYPWCQTQSRDSGLP